jgi:uncharacterized membrane protein
MDIALILKTLHVLSAMALVAGIVGRQLVRSQARKTADLKTFQELSALAGQFENKLVIPGSNLVFVFGLALALLQGWPILGFLQGAPQNWLLVSNLLLVSMILVIPLIFVPRGKLFEAALKEALEHGEITPPLTARYNDPVVRRAHLWEEISLAGIIILMITKPF